MYLQRRGAEHRWQHCHGVSTLCDSTLCARANRDAMSMRMVELIIITQAVHTLRLTRCVCSRKASQRTGWGSGTRAGRLRIPRRARQRRRQRERMPCIIHCPRLEAGPCTCPALSAGSAVHSHACPPAALVHACSRDHGTINGAPVTGDGLSIHNRCRSSLSEVRNSGRLKIAPGHTRLPARGGSSCRPPHSRVSSTRIALMHAAPSVHHT